MNFVSEEELNQYLEELKNEYIEDSKKYDKYFDTWVEGTKLDHEDEDEEIVFYKYSSDDELKEQRENEDECLFDKEIIEDF